MYIPSKLFQMVPDFSEVVVYQLTGAGLKKLFQDSDGFKNAKYQEMFSENFLHEERMGPRDIQEFISDNVNEAMHPIFENVSEYMELFVDVVDQSFVYLSGSMDELENIMEQIGIEMPEGLDFIPGASELILGVRLLLDIKRVNNEFVGISQDKKINIAAAKALVIMSKFGVSITLVSLGTAAGGAGGGMLGGVGAIIGAPLGAITGGVTAGYINKKIAPYAQELSYKLLKLEKEDLFYYKNKARIDEIGHRLRSIRIALEN
jgi:hypothetical protein